jgi:NADH-quinone oxidoreductase subunit L
VGGWLELPSFLGKLSLFSGFMHEALPKTPGVDAAGNIEGLLALLAGAASLGGIGLAYLLFLRSPRALDRLMRTAPVAALRAFWHEGWGFDKLYDRALVRPYRWLAQVDQHDFVDAIYTGAAQLCRLLYRALSATQTGRVRWYAAWIASGAIVVIFIAVFA